MRNLIACSARSACFAALLALMQHSVVLAADPTTADCLAASERSIALRTKHQLRSARAELLICAAPTCPEDVRSECARRVGEVNAQMPTIVFETKDAENNDLSAVAVSMDGQPLVERLEGTALSIDPGEHRFVFSGEHMQSMEKRFIIREGEKGRREKIVLGLEATPPNPAVTSPSGLLPAEPVDDTNIHTQQLTDHASEQSSQRTKRLIGIVVGAAGCVGLGVALAEQLTAKSRDSKSEKAAMSPDPAVQATVKPLYHQAEQAQTYAIVIGTLGAVAVSTGLYLVLSSLGREEHDSHHADHARLVPSFGPTSGGLTYLQQF